MKRILSVCLSASILAALTACGAEENPISFEQSDNVSVQTPSDTSVASELQADEEQKLIQALEESASLQEEETVGKTLIAYFSLADIVPEGADASAHATPSVGNTESAAIEIQNQVGGDLFAIHTVQTYPVNHRECSAIAEEEMRSDARPELSTHVENMEQYDTVYIGYPIWWYMEPMAIRTFLEEYDFTGKTVIPFCTTLGAGIGESEENIASLASGATVLEGVTLSTGRQDMSEDISSWLADIGMENKERRLKP